MLTPQQLFGEFPDETVVPGFVPVPASDVPEPYRRLLVHTHHMTVTVEAAYGDAVNVQVLSRVQHGVTYTRQILLVLQGTGKVVQYGLVRMDLAVLHPEVREQILGEQIPLGRVLIEHNVLRHIEPAGYFRVELSPQLLDWFQLPAPAGSYGRLGIIHTNGVPTVEVLEILAPVAGEALVG